MENNHLKHWHIFSIFLLFFKISTSQSISEISVQIDSTWLEFKQQLNINPTTIFQQYKTEFRLGSDDEFIIKKIKNDGLGMTHYRYQQTYKGIPVLGGEYTIHSKGNISITGNGNIIKNLSMDILPSIDSSTAIQQAIKEVREKEAEKYNISTNCITLMFDSAHPYKLNLVIAKLLPEAYSTINYKLIYQVEVRILEPSDFIYYVLIDAKTGVTLEIIPGVFYASGTVTTLYNGYRNVESKWTGSITKYKLIDESRGDGITTRRKRSGFNQYVNDNDNNWDDDYKSRIHASTHWAASMVWDFYVTLGRSGPDGNGMGLDIITDQYPIYYGSTCSSENCPSNSSAAATNPLQMNFSGPVSGKCDPRISVNTVGHEFTHGVVYYEANWGPLTIVPSDEAYALMEGYCDIFGEMVEFYIQGWVDWKYDDQSYIDKTCVKTFAPPIQDCVSAIGYGDNNWNNNPDGHSRGGVLRYWFYLLSIGGSGTNHLGNIFCVDGIGIPKASQILYKTLNDNYLNTSSTFASTRNATIQVAKYLYGNNSNEVAQVTNAWFAVAVGSDFSGYIPYDNLTVIGTKIISNNNEIRFTNLQVTPSGSLTVTSSTKIVMNPTSKATSSSYFHAYIALCGADKKITTNNSTTNAIDYLQQQKLIVPINNFQTPNQPLQFFNAFPNPFSSSTEIVFSLLEPTDVIIYITNFYGMKIMQLHNSHTAEGMHTISFNTTMLQQGVYFCIIETSTKRKVVKVVKM